MGRLALPWYKQSKPTQKAERLRGRGCGRVKRSSHRAVRPGIFIKPTRHHVRGSLQEKCCSQMELLSQIYLLRSSFHVDYITTSQQERTARLRCQPACLAQGESDVGQTEDTVLSMLSSEKNPQQITGCSESSGGCFEGPLACMSHRGMRWS